MNASEPNPTPPHEANENEASNGAGTVNTPLEGDTLDHPVLDGSTEHYSREEAEKNDWYGEDDPALTRHPEKDGKKTAAPYDVT